MTPDLLIGTEVAGHRIEELIGRGGSATVYLAEHLRLGRKVALKLLHPELSKDETFRERFIREAQAAATLHHPNIVTVFDAGEFEDLLYMSMLYVEGTDLSRLLKREGPMQADRAVWVASRVADGLDAAHGRGFVHRDVKPANILIAEGRVGEQGRVYLSDFGIAKPVRALGGPTRTGQFVGTIDYVAPEQIMGGPVDGRADQYSLACVLCECLTGEAAFPRETDVAVIYAHLGDPPPSLKARRSELPAAADEVIARAMSKTPADRYASSGAFADAAATAFRARATTRFELPARSGRRGRKQVIRWVWAAIAAGAVAALAITSVIALRPEEPEEVPPNGDELPTVKSLTWERLFDPEVLGGDGNQEILRAIASEGGLVAVGHEGPGPAELDAAVWTSDDGMTWRQAEPSTDLGGTGAQRATSVAGLGGTLVAVGFEDLGEDDDAAVWTSSDGGVTWTRVRFDPGEGDLTGPGDQRMRFVIELNSRLVAVGYVPSPQGDRDTGVWESDDGINWEQRDNADFGGPGDQEASTVAALGSLLVAAGTETIDGDKDAAIWVSDGIWSRVEGQQDLVGPDAQQIQEIVAGGPGLVAVGYVGDPEDWDAAVWTSSDGAGWTRVQDPGGELGVPGDGDQQIFTVARWGTELVAIGTDERLGGALWVSADGMSWSRVQNAPIVLVGPRQHPRDMLTFGDVLMAFGREGGGSNDDAAVWKTIPPLE